MTRFAPLTRALVAALVAAVLVAPPPAVAAPEGQLTWGVHITLIPTYFDPADTPGLVTPFMILYALHDALVKPMPGRPHTLAGRVVDGLEGRARLRLRPSPGREVPHR